MLKKVPPKVILPPLCLAELLRQLTFQHKNRLDYFLYLFVIIIYFYIILPAMKLFVIDRATSA